MANPTVKTGIAQEANLAFALWVSPDVVGGSGAWDAKNGVRHATFGSLNSVALGTSGKNGLISTATNCGIALGGSNNHVGTPYDFSDTTWTVIALVRPVSSGGTPVVIQNMDAWSPNKGYQLDHSGTFVEAITQYNTARITAASGSGVAVTNQAMTLAVVSNTTTLKIFKNGAQIASTSHAASSVDYASTATRVAGLFNTAQAKGTNAVPLEIYAVIGWNVALTAAELQTFGTTEAALLAGDFYSAAFSFSASNSAPVFSGPAIGNQYGTVGTPLSLNVASKFTDSDALTFSAVGSWPPGVTVSSSGLISGTPTTAAVYPGLQVRATDTASQTVDSDTFSFTVNPDVQMVSAANSQQANTASTGSVIQSSGGTIQLPPLSEWETGNLLAGQVGITVWINDEDSGLLMVKLTGISTAPVTAAFSPISHVSLLPGTAYSVRTRLASGAQYTWTYLAS